MDAKGWIEEQQSKLATDLAYNNEKISNFQKAIDELEAENAEIQDKMSQNEKDLDKVKLTDEQMSTISKLSKNK